MFGACGGSVSSGSGGGGAATTTASTTSSSSGSGGSVSKVCAAALPEDGSACSIEGQVCEYGDNPLCLSSATCKGGVWSLLLAKCPGEDPTCPPTREEAAGQPCVNENGICNYDGLICTCTNCIEYPVEKCEGPLLWSCAAPNPTPGCPAAKPNLGTACTQEGLACDYGCEMGDLRVCQGGAWVAGEDQFMCPISTILAKTDVTYLDGESRARVAEEAKSLRLATFRYIDPALGDRRHLGIILEDAPDSPAADMAKLQVDLYAYTSMVLALAQEHEREIARLRAEIERLERAMAAKGAKAR